MKINWIEIGVCVALIAGLSYGIGEYSDFWRAFSIICPTVGALLLIYVVYLKDILIEKKEISDEVIATYDNLVIEQQQVIQEYEAILDTQYISIECECKKGKFEGFFDKNLENLVTCDECGNNYKIIPSYDVILIAEPLDLEKNDEIFEKLKNQEELPIKD